MEMTTAAWPRWVGIWLLAALCLHAPVVAAQEAPAVPPSDAPAEAPAATGHLSPAEIAAVDSARIQEALAGAYSRAVGLGGVEVAVGSGVVTLSGEVDRPSARQAAETIAQKIEGVLWVDNQIEVIDEAVEAGEEIARRTVQDEAIQERLATIFGRVDELQGLEVDVEGGVVRLSGEVPSAEARRRAEELASGLDGVVYVDNDVTEVRELSKRLEPTLDRLYELGGTAVSYAPLVLVALAILVLFWIVSQLVARFDLLFRRLDDRPLVQSIVRQLVSVVVFLIGVLVVLEIFDVTALVGAVLGTAGVVGLALGFAFQDIAENYLASIMLSLRRPFSHNDLIRIEDYEGKVVRLTTRDTVLMTLEGNHIRLPNAFVFKSVIHNYTQNARRRFAIEVGVGVEEDLVEVRQLGLAELNDMAGVLADPPPFARVEALGDWTVKVTFYGWVDQAQYDWFNVRSEAINVVKTALDAAGVSMPYPIYQVNLNEPGAQAEPVRERVERPGEPAPPEVVNLKAEAEIDDQITHDRRTSGEADLLEE